jgi:hypothetical protein
MAAGASVTCTHCSVLFEVTWGKTRRVRVDAGVRLRERISLPSLSLPPLPCPLSLPPLGCLRGRAKKNYKIIKKIW